MELRTVGMYREMYEGDHGHLPSIYESVATRALPDRDAVVRYLRESPGAFDVMEDTPHLLDERQTIPGGPSLHSDGEWIWRVDSIEYLAHQPLEIPAELVEHVRARDYRPPTALDWTDEFDAAVMRYF